jgi:hypothetical protein
MDKLLKSIVFICCFSALSFSQSRLDTIRQVIATSKGYFSKNTAQQFGFYRELKRDNENQVAIHASKSVGFQTIDWVNFDINPKHVKHIDSVTFLLNDLPLESTRLNQNKCAITLPKFDEDAAVIAMYHGQELARLNVFVFQPKKISISLIPLVKTHLNLDSITSELNQVFAPLNFQFDIRIHPRFQVSKTILDQQMDNPSTAHLRYTMQMQHIRDAYLQKNASKIENELIFFLTPNFQDTTVKAYMVKNKAMGFIAETGIENLASSLALLYMNGYANIENQAKTIPTNFTVHQWVELYNNPQVFSYIDDYEEVVTNNGLVAYYYFEQDEHGNLILQDNSFLNSVQRPIKKNTFSYHLQIDNFLYQTLFSVAKKPFNSLHLIGIIAVIALIFWLFVKFKKYLKTKFSMVFIFRMFFFVFHWSVTVCCAWLIILLVDMGYAWFEVKNGEIKSYAGLSKAEVLDQLFLNEHPNKIEEPSMGAELVIKKGSHYFIYELKPVLYFKETIDSTGKVLNIRFVSNSDSLKTRLLSEPVLAKSHYLVVKQYNPEGKWIKDVMYNHLGVNLSEKVSLVDPPKRILLFVNGYRPTSIGSSFEENFADIQKYGFEFPNSSNRIYTEDRYNYWHPWMQIDDAFKARINPTETYFADGHHSVSTSNHRSLLKFTTFSQVYPKRCDDPKKHTCQETQIIGWSFFDSAKKNTYNLLATRPNKRGFKTRVNSGRVAGRNLFQLLNEIPNLSNNDTLYIVAHSMGFAYAQGIVNQLRGKINFGSFYIIAPENAKSGLVNVSEWKEVWQYGSNLGRKNQDAPCLQDGIAPQSTAKGLPESNRIVIPENRCNTKGYFDSHFIGWYTWVLQIPQGQPGYIQQR